MAFGQDQEQLNLLNRVLERSSLEQAATAFTYEPSTEEAEEG